MSLNEDDVIQIMKILNESKFESLNLKMDDLEITVNKNEPFVSSETHEIPLRKNVDSMTAPHTNSATIETDHIGVNNKPKTESDAAQRGIEEAIAEQGLIPIKSPMLGIFYEAPKPDEDPFVELDALISKETTVCTIEVMKLFSTIKAGVNGRVKRICVQNGDLVEHGQILFLVDPLVD